MRLGPWITGFFAASAGTLLYGALVEANRLVLEKHRLRLPNWPERLNGYKIAVLADTHLRDRHSVEMTHRAIEMAFDESPDMVVIAGDLVGYWKPESCWLLADAFGPLLAMQGNAIAIAGNHDYWSGDAGMLAPVLDELNIKLLRNEVWHHDGIAWAGIDSVNELRADPFTTMAAAAGSDPIVALWHEPDAVEWLPSGASLMISGHSHGGQFVFPWGWQPMSTRNGEKYVRGSFPDAPTPLYVSRGIGTTGPPSRLCATPEVSLLILETE